MWYLPTLEVVLVWSLYTQSIIVHVFSEYNSNISKVSFFNLFILKLSWNCFRSMSSQYSKTVKSVNLKYHIKKMGLFLQLIHETFN